MNVKDITLDQGVLRQERFGDYNAHVAYIYDSSMGELKPDPCAIGAVYFDLATNKLYVDNGFEVYAVGLGNEDILNNPLLNRATIFSNSNMYIDSYGFEPYTIVNSGIITSNTISDGEVISSIIDPLIVVDSSVILSETTTATFIYGPHIIDGAIVVFGDPVDSINNTTTFVDGGAVTGDPLSPIAESVSNSATNVFSYQLSDSFQLVEPIVDLLGIEIGTLTTTVETVFTITEGSPEPIATVTSTVEDSVLGITNVYQTTVQPPLIAGAVTTDSLIYNIATGVVTIINPVTSAVLGILG